LVEDRQSCLSGRTPDRQDCLSSTGEILPVRPAPQPAHARLRGGADRVDEGDRGVAELFADAHLRLEDDVDRAELQRAHGQLARRLGEARADHDRQRRLVHQLAQKGQPVHARHFQIEDDHVGTARLHLGHRDQRIGRGGDGHRRSEQRGHDLADDGGVVDHEDVERAHRAALEYTDGAIGRRRRPELSRLSEWPRNR